MEITYLALEAYNTEEDDNREVGDANFGIELGQTSSIPSPVASAMATKTGHCSKASCNFQAAGRMD